jgi:beta-glucosidase/6-phospho-beta-glucosidase/beta-galactosidase
MDPLTKGDYPESMRATVGSRLPTFTSAEKDLIKGSLDFVALNYYFPYLASPGTLTDSEPPSFWKDMNVTSSNDPSWPLSQTGWGIYGPGLRDLLIYTAKNYDNLPQYVTENGLAWEELTVEEAVNDVMRQQYLYDHIEAIGEALASGVNLKGYFIWSFQVSADHSMSSLSLCLSLSFSSSLCLPLS